MKALSSIITEFKIFTMNSPTDQDSDSIDNPDINGDENDNSISLNGDTSASSDSELETLTTHLRNDFEVLLKTFEKQYTDNKSTFADDSDKFNNVDNSEDFQDTPPDESVNFNNPTENNNEPSDNLHNGKFDFNF